MRSRDRAARGTNGFPANIGQAQKKTVKRKIVTAQRRRLLKPARRSRLLGARLNYDRGPKRPRSESCSLTSRRMETRSIVEKRAASDAKNRICLFVFSFSCFPGSFPAGRPSRDAGRRGRPSSRCSNRPCRRRYSSKQDLRSIRSDHCPHYPQPKRRWRRSQ